MRNAWLPVTTVIGLETERCWPVPVLTETGLLLGMGWAPGSSAPSRTTTTIVVQSLILIFAHDLPRK